jgi:hypothetical protein
MNNMYMYLYICVCVFIYIDVCICICKFVYTYKFVYIYICIYTYTHIYTRIDIIHINYLTSCIVTTVKADAAINVDMITQKDIKLL